MAYQSHRPSDILGEHWFKTSGNCFHNCLINWTIHPQSFCPFNLKSTVRSRGWMVRWRISRSRRPISKYIGFKRSCYFLPYDLTNPFSVNMAEPKHKIDSLKYNTITNIYFFVVHQRMDADSTRASSSTCRDSAGAKFLQNYQFFAVLHHVSCIMYSFSWVLGRHFHKGVRNYFTGLRVIAKIL